MSKRIGSARYEKRFRIGVRFDGAKFLLLNGDPLPAVANGSVAELVLAPECIQDPNVRARLTGEISVQILEKGSVVLLGVSPSMVNDLRADGLVRAKEIPILSEYLFVEVKLNEHQWLQVRGDQEARLSPCDCTITALKRNAQSINHAFTLISEAFETRRRSHSGNVFLRAYARVDSEQWSSLDDLRLAAVGKMP